MHSPTSTMSPELNLPTLSFAVSHWVVTVPARLGQVQRYLCTTQAVAQRLLALFVRAREATARRSGWPFTR
ncbi:MAG: hypothetical protein JNJ54_01590 [Myxococcaceae bacterium]|nr:hypothetical protein [Myxococcaceae bacterium]